MAWTHLDANQFILKTITNCRIPFSSKPPLCFPNQVVQKSCSTKMTPAMTETIEKLKGQKILERPPVQDAGFYSKMFLVKKPDGSHRPIFDLRNLNKFVSISHFQLVSQVTVMEFLQDQDWLVKIDLHQAYFHLPISESHRRYLRIIYNREVLQLTALPFGLSSAPHIFAAVSNWIAETLRARGIRVLVYLDDYLLVHQDRSKLITQVAETVSTLEALGWHINYQKSILEPTQQLDYLGLTWNTQEMIMTLPEQKVKNIKAILTQLKDKGSCTLKELQSILGLLNFANLTVQRGRLHCRRLQMFLKKFNQGRLRERRVLPPLAVRELEWWLRAVEKNTTSLKKTQVTHFLTTDAADAGWGAHLNGSYLSGQWSRHQQKWHSNVKEMFAVYGAIASHQNTLRDAHILIQTDNRTLVAYIRNEGGTRSIALLDLTTKLLHLTDQLNVTLSACYLPGRLNGIADRLSRGRPLPEWHLLPRATEVIFRQWGVPEIDLFASRKSAIVPKYVTLDSQDGYAQFCDAFSRQWDWQLAWVFPPPNLIPRVLAHLNNARGKYIVIAPQWTQCYWLPDLKARALVEPLPIHNLESSLIDLTTELPPPQVKDLTFLAWKVGGGAVK
ncbi:hypothetical protein ABMA28_016184 [Loxostege sticticalis]|uniref:Reverse transcriptase domain-containing protein n=1 Tax=Loxostege sticticalis TaxID=481309 RepID=A0ABD0TBR9_LOXSC